MLPIMLLFVGLLGWMSPRLGFFLLMFVALALLIH